MKRFIFRGLVTAAFLAGFVGTVHADPAGGNASPGLGTLIYQWLCHCSAG